MNNRIFEIIQGINGQVGLQWEEKDKQELAELIVQECIDIVAAGGEFASRPKLVEKLQEHFGVEE